MEPAQEKNHQTRLRALVISGWSDGPLNFLKQRFQDQVEFHDITDQIPTPPIGLKCWCNPYLFLMFMLIILFFYGINVLLESQLQTFVKFIILCLGVATLYIVGKRFLLAKFLNFSIRHCCGVVKSTLKSGHYDMVIGFSWGGAIAWWCICEGIWRGKTLMLAPTIEIMANLANLKFPLLNSSDSDQVAVIHAEGDPFTPKEQVAKIKSCGSLISMYECRDSHVFELFSSEDLIEKVFCRQFLQ
eukprot:g15050.t1